MLFLTIENGVRCIRAHPGWILPETGGLLTAEQLLARDDYDGLPIIDEPPAYDPATQIISLDPIEDWILSETTATKTYTVSAKPPPSGDDVNRERERRILTGTAVTIDGYGDVPLQGREEDRSNLSDLAFAASLRIGAGDVTTTSVFRDRDNVDHDLTPPQFIEMWSQASAYVSAIYAASWAIKAMAPIPLNFSDDANWP
ncbi:uncharacterized protein DUF4376 [Hoeflea marina]|uniref:Uncharacterized protein DUF4376 n=1 Tax=Hoeflea marina TaxID=274592 RepID=A0A317PE85_9HYPH|nr:DUF4376 domain-containing protein [Hoeflea marina]PWV97700.1 uncharacterized protein DUF4376 [Hoeflea marina]